MAWLRWTIGALALMLGLSLALPVTATTGTPLSVCIRPVLAGQTPAALFAQPAGFDCTTAQTKFGGGDFWILSQRLPAIAAGDHDPSVRIGSTWVHRVTLYVLYADGSIRRSGFTSRTAGRLLGLGAVIVQPVPRHDVAPSDCSGIWRARRTCAG
ncbi:hypothetical protein QP162_03000 [Sphingomonas aurantiaca]|uniref:hypothetical protein n=1 Tax=Sphingomonas aurantiaca TaxID=185949 RepID=UPI002FE0B699